MRWFSPRLFSPLNFHCDENRQPVKEEREAQIFPFPTFPRRHVYCGQWLVKPQSLESRFAFERGKEKLTFFAQRILFSATQSDSDHFNLSHSVYFATLYFDWNEGIRELLRFGIMLL